MRRLLLFVCCLVTIGASRPATAGQFEQIEKELTQRMWFQKIADEAYRPDIGARREMVRHVSLSATGEQRRFARLLLGARVDAAYLPG